MSQTRRWRAAVGLLWVVLTALSAPPSSAQTLGNADRVPLPPVIHECDSNCNTLTLVGDHYVVPPQPWEHPTGPVVWNIESFTRGLVALHRHFPVDSVFRGRINADGTGLEQVSIDGRPANVRFAWGAALASVPGSNAERDRQAAQARAAPVVLSPADDVAVPLPPVIHECDSNCNTLTLVGDHYVVPPQAWEHPPGPIVWEVESFKRGLVALHRHFPVDSIFRGRVSADGNQLEQVSIDGRPAPVRFAWGAALDSVPGSNAERDHPAQQARITPTPSAPATAGVGKTAGATADPIAEAALLMQNGHCDEGIAALQRLSETDPNSAQGRIVANLLQASGCKPGAAPVATAPPQASGGAGARPRTTLTLPGYVQHSAAADLAQKIANDCTRVKDLQRLAESGDAEGQAWFGALHYQAVCVKTDPAQGLLWTRRAAEAGSAFGEYNLGVAYREGLGVAIDVPEAISWFRKSAEQHYPPAESNLGVAYMAGQGVGKDAVQGVRWLRASIEHDGPPNGAHMLGLAYLSGDGVARDEGEARKWFAAAAAQGYADAQIRIADMNCRGVGAPPNLPRCMMWLQVATAAGNPVTARMRGGLGAKMSPMQQMQADELVRQYAQQNVVQRVQSEMSAAQDAAAGKPAVITWGQLGEMMGRRSPSGFTLGEALCASASVMTVNQEQVDAKVRSGMSRDAARQEVVDANLDQAQHCLEH